MKTKLKIVLIALLIFELLAAKNEEMSQFVANKAAKIQAMIEAKTLKNLWGGNCRIVNLLPLFKSKKNNDLYIVLGTIEFKNKKDYHLWLTTDKNKAYNINYIIDNAVDNNYTNRKQIYNPGLVLKLNIQTCNVNVVKQNKDLKSLNQNERILYKKYFTYINQFCLTKTRG